MTFPSNPNDNDIHEAFGRRLKYKESTSTWEVVSSPAVAIETEAPAATTAVATSANLPLTGNQIGAMSYSQDTNTLYVWNGTGWFKIALVNTNPNITNNGGSATYELASDGTPTVVTLTANDPEGVPLTWSYAVTSGALEDTTVVNNGAVFTVTPGETAATFDLTFTASDGVNVDTSTISFFPTSPRKLWRLLSVTNPPNANLWDNDGIVNAKNGWWNGSTSVTAGLTLSSGPLQPGKWNAFAENSNPLLDSPLSVADAGPANGTLDPNVGGRSAFVLTAGRYVAVYFANEVTDITKMYHRTFQANRPGRIPPNTSLQYYNGNLSTAYDSSKWVTYATLTDESTFGWVIWNNISEGSTVVSISAV
jgi:hypothetical protein